MINNLNNIPFNNLQYSNRNMQYSFDPRPLAILAICALLSGCGEGSKDGGQTASAAPVIQDTVQVFLLKRDTANKTVDLPSELFPYLQTDLFAKVQGFVQEMKVDIGDRVYKGQTLAVIEAPEVRT